MAGERTLPGAGLTAGWTPGTGGWATGMDDNLRAVSAAMQLSVLSMTTALPGSPSDGVIYIVRSDDGTNPNKIAIRDNGAWVYLTPVVGWVAWVQDGAKFVYYTGSAWTDMLANVNWSVSTKTDNYTLTLTDRKSTVIMNAGSSKNVTVPPNSSVAFAIGDEIEVMRYGAGAVVIVPGAGVTVRSPGGGLTMNTQYSIGKLRKIGTDEWDFVIIAAPTSGLASTDISDFTEAAQDAVAALIAAGTSLGLTTSYNDAGNAIGFNVGFEINIQAEDVLDNAEVIFRHKATRPFTIPSGTSLKSAYSNVAATGSATISIKKNGVSAGTIAWSASGTAGTFAVASDIVFAADDIMTVEGPATADATLAQIAIAIVCTR